MATENIPDGKSLTYALEKEVSGLFLELAIMCKAVVCCTQASVKFLAYSDDAPQVAFRHYRKLLSSSW